MPVFDWPAHARTTGSPGGSRGSSASSSCSTCCASTTSAASSSSGSSRSTSRIRRDGSWGEGPGIAFFDAARERLDGLPLIVEDLGHITPDVIELREADRRARA